MLGREVIPIDPVRHEPIADLASGWLAASTSQATIRRWWAKYPDALVGVALFGEHVVLGKRRGDGGTDPIAALVTRIDRDRFRRLMVGNTLPSSPTSTLLSPSRSTPATSAITTSATSRRRSSSTDATDVDGAADGQAQARRSRDDGQPRETRGIIDTFKLRIEVPIADGDRQRLVEVGFRQTTAGMNTLSGVAWSRYHRRSDNAVVSLSKGSIRVQVTMPRLCGFKSNFGVAQVSEADVCKALLALIDDVFPETTAMAANVGRFWHFIRMDLAIDIPANPGLLIHAYACATTPRTRYRLPDFYGGEVLRDADADAADDDVLPGESLVWRPNKRGGGYRLHLYDKGKQLAATKQAREVEPGRVCRFECQLKDRRGLGMLVEVLDVVRGVPLDRLLARGLLPIATPRGVVAARLDYDRFHAFLRGEAEALHGQREVVVGARDMGSGAARDRDAKWLMYLALAEHPELLDEIEGSPAKRRKYAAGMFAVRAKLAEVDLVRMAWPEQRAVGRARPG